MRGNIDLGNMEVSFTIGHVDISILAELGEHVLSALSLFHSEVGDVLKRSP